MTDELKSNKSTVKSIFGIIGNIVSKIILILLIILLAVNIYSLVVKSTTSQQFTKIFGYTNAVVISGSMEPSINVDDMVIIKEEDSYQVGDVITFVQGNNTGTTHRIVEKTDNGFITKGDNNNTEDTALVTEDQIIGKVVCVIPHMGNVFNFLSSPIGLFAISFICFAMVEISYLVPKRKRTK